MTYVNKIQLPQYSKDGIVPVTKVINNMSSLSWLLRDLVANKTTEITALLEKRELPDGISYSVDSHLLEQGKPQRYGTHIKKEKEKTVLQSPMTV